MSETTPPSPSAVPVRRLSGRLIPILGYSLSIAGLVWGYHGFDWRRELPRILAADWRWVLLAVVFDWVVYICQGLRWTALLSPLGPISVWKSTQAIYIGLFANEILPLRSGEVIRCYLQRRWTGLPLSVIVSSVLVERLWDGVWLIAAFSLVASRVELPGFLEVMSRGLLILLAILMGLLAAAMLYRKRTEAVVAGSRWARRLRPVVDGLYLMGRSRSFWWAGFLSFWYLALQIVPLYALLRGYRLDLTPWAALVLLVIVRLGTVIPQAPGNVGSFQALIVAGLGIFGYSKADATGFATLSFFVVTVPLLFGGFVALMLTRMRLGDIQREAQASLADDGD
ncbi:MAG: flippase-like domain-containing protein [Bryobacterales bacterium]|nr:flippase-like domain-containing protein [Bryobacterales bacterium]